MGKSKLTTAYGFQLPSQVRAACLAELKLESFLKKSFKKLEYIDGSKTSYPELVVKKVATEARIKIINDTYEKIPETYRAAVRYLVTSKDSIDNKEIAIEEKHCLDYKETLLWLEKLLYFYADSIGYPVSKSTKEFDIEVEDDGIIEIL